MDCDVTLPVNYSSSLLTTRGKENELPMYQMSYIGYNPVDVVGSLNLPTFAVNDSLSISYKYRFIVDPNETLGSYSAGILTTDTAYSALNKLVTKINAGGLIAADIVGANGTQVAVADGAATRVFTKGSNVVTLGGVATTIVAGDWIKIQNLQPLVPPSTGINTMTAATTAANSILYFVTTKTGTTSITLDRPYTGETQSVNITTFNASVIRETALSTNLGIRLIAKPNTNVSYPIYDNFVFTFQGTDDLSNATTYDHPSAGITAFRGVDTGSGTTNHMLNIEKDAAAYNGQASGKTDSSLAYVKPYPSQVDQTVNTYDLYFSTITPRTTVPTIVNGGYGFGQGSSLAVAFPTGAPSAGDNQFDYDVLIKLLTTYMGDVSLSA